MDQGLLPRRYAKALYKFADERHDTQAVYGFMENLDAAFDANPRLQQTIANPFVKTADKVALLTTAAGKNADSSATLADFIKLLVENRRIDLAREIALAYMDTYRKANNIYKVSVISAAPLSQADNDRLKALVEKHLDGGTAQYENAVQPDLIGGFVINIDNERLDASVKHELEQLRLALLN